MPLDTGQLLQQGRYRIVKRLGEGGMGAVYRAWDTRLNMPVALKEMVPQPGLDSQMLLHFHEQFWQEAKVMARLNHPNLVRVTDFFDLDSRTYLVMDYVEGQSLEQYIKDHGAVEESQILAWAEQLLDALAYCHSQGIIHRDIKPQNVIIRPDGRVVLVDFGLVKLWDPNDPRTKTAMRGMGTPEYAPPEQYEMRQGHTDIRSDIYSLGATLYHALTGQAPPTATLRVADPHQFSAPRSIVPNVSRKTESVILKALELDRSARWQNATEMAAALGVSLPEWNGTSAVEKTLALPASGRGGTERITGERPRERRRRSMPVWVWIIAAVVLLCGLVGGGIAVFGQDLRQAIFPPAEPTATATTEVSPTPTVPLTSTSTATSVPTDTPTPTPTPQPTSLPEVEILSPDDDAGYYTTSWVPLEWDWFRELEEDERFVVLVEDEGGNLRYSATVAPDEGREHTFRAVDQGLEPGTYTWYIQSQQQLAGEWEVTAESAERTLRVVQPPADTPEPTQEPTQAPTEAPTQEPQPQPTEPQPQPTEPPPTQEPTEPPPPPTYTPEPP